MISYYDTTSHDLGDIIFDGLRWMMGKSFDLINGGCFSKLSIG